MDPEPGSLAALVADDNVDNARSLATILEILGCEVTVAVSGTEAIKVAATSPPDVAFVDLNMPDFNGHEVADEIRRIKEERPVFIVCITGRLLQRHEIDEITSDGFDLVLFKPVDLIRIEEILQATSARNVANGSRARAPDGPR